jgi:hypothetical protein
MRRTAALYNIPEATLRFYLKKKILKNAMKSGIKLRKLLMSLKKLRKFLKSSRRRNRQKLRVEFQKSQ